MSTDGWPPELGDAHRAPWAVAERWRAGGGRVVGLLGRRAPRELVTAAGMLPIRLDPARLSADPARLSADPARLSADPDRQPDVPARLSADPDRQPDVPARLSADPDRQPEVPEGLDAELSPDTTALLAALLRGELGWLDALLIGRDSEAHTRLFYVIRELAADREFAPLMPRFAFSDILLLPLRTSAVYNRVRLRELAAVISEWGERGFDDAALRAAIHDDELIRERLRELRRLRAQGLVSAHEVAGAEWAAQILPGDGARVALAAACADASSRNPGPSRPRVFLTGSEPRPDMCSVIESTGLLIAGDDHGWDAHAPVPEEPEADPISWLADRYQFSTVGTARSGLGRAATAADQARALDVDAVLQIVLPGDEASAWELPRLRQLSPDRPVVSAQLGPGSEDAQLRESASALADLLQQGHGAAGVTGDGAEGLGRDGGVEVTRDGAAGATGDGAHE